MVHQLGCPAPEDPWHVASSFHRYSNLEDIRNQHPFFEGHSASRFYECPGEQHVSCVSARVHFVTWESSCRTQLTQLAQTQMPMTHRMLSALWFSATWRCCPQRTLENIFCVQVSLLCHSKRSQQEHAMLSISHLQKELSNYVSCSSEN